MGRAVEGLKGFFDVVGAWENWRLEEEREMSLVLVLEKIRMIRSIFNRITREILIRQNSNQNGFFFSNLMSRLEFLNQQDGFFNLTWSKLYTLLKKSKRKPLQKNEKKAL